MKFLFSRDLRDLPHIRLAVIFFNFAILLFWALNWFYEQGSFGLWPSEVRLKILGDAEAFAPMMTIDVLLLNVHIRLFMYTILLLTLSAVFFRLSISQKWKVSVVSATYTAVLVHMLSILLVRFASEQFVYLKVASFVALQMMVLLMSLQALGYLLLPKKKGPPHVSHG